MVAMGAWSLNEQQFEEPTTTARGLLVVMQRGAFGFLAGGWEFLGASELLTANVHWYWRGLPGLVFALVTTLVKYRNEVCLYNIMFHVCLTCLGCVIFISHSCNWRRWRLPMAFYSVLGIALQFFFGFPVEFLFLHLFGSRFCSRLDLKSANACAYLHI